MKDEPRTHPFRDSVEDIAAAAQMSVRSLARAFRDVLGLTPIEYQQRLRLELAATLLHNPAGPHGTLRTWNHRSPC